MVKYMVWFLTNARQDVFMCTETLHSFFFPLCLTMTKHSHRHKRSAYFNNDSCFFFFFTASDETKRKMYSSVLVVGGGLLFHGAQEFLQHRILNKMPPSFRRMVENVEVITRPKVSAQTAAHLSMYYSYTYQNCTEMLQEVN